MENSFANYIENLFTNHIKNSSTNHIAVNESVELDIDTGMDESVEVDEGTEVDDSMEVDEEAEIDYTEINFDSYEAIQDDANFVNHTNNENSCKIN
ncbi:23082_t:CDS:2 [Cetraspora pellucida]|uniref:23082_t:CDS:1 n=1 Tax=Cetraspora pellucida TaxID=1433469 RepID=A0A9N9ETV3_9GLOM|nr:23082_t:CDS:2 [Cetraspora pellucida]